MCEKHIAISQQNANLSATVPVIIIQQKHDWSNSKY